jgi:hypothetical protein
MSREPEKITVFHVDEAYYFAHFFDRQDVFSELSEYYDDHSYRFEVPESEWEDVATTLRSEYFETDVVEDVEPYCVVTGKYDQHADVLRDSVLHWERRGHRFFVMKSAFAVETAIEAGATPIEETEFEAGI